MKTDTIIKTSVTVALLSLLIFMSYLVTKDRVQARIDRKESERVTNLYEKMPRCVEHNLDEVKKCKTSKQVIELIDECMGTQEWHGFAEGRIIERIKQRFGEK